jgi:hypothetical protein
LQAWGHIQMLDNNSIVGLPASLRPAEMHHFRLISANAIIKLFFGMFVRQLLSKDVCDTAILCRHTYGLS